MISKKGIIEGIKILYLIHVLYTCLTIRSLFVGNICHDDCVCARIVEKRLFRYLMYLELLVFIYVDRLKRRCYMIKDKK